jgi:hypothetical protein
MIVTKFRTIILDPHEDQLCGSTVRSSKFTTGTELDELAGAKAHIFWTLKVPGTSRTDFLFLLLLLAVLGGIAVRKKDPLALPSNFFARRIILTKPTGGPTYAHQCSLDR